MNKVSVCATNRFVSCVGILHSNSAANRYLRRSHRVLSRLRTEDECEPQLPTMVRRSLEAQQAGP